MIGRQTVAARARGKRISGATLQTTPGAHLEEFDQQNSKGPDIRGMGKLHRLHRLGRRPADREHAVLRSIVRLLQLQARRLSNRLPSTRLPSNRLPRTRHAAIDSKTVAVAVAR